MIKYIANIVTGFRILGSILLLFFPAFSAAFYMIYILCGLSDMIDGTIARMVSRCGKLKHSVYLTATQHQKPPCEQSHREALPVYKRPVVFKSYGRGCPRWIP